MKICWHIDHSPYGESYSLSTPISGCIASICEWQHPDEHNGMWHVIIAGNSQYFIDANVPIETALMNTQRKIIALMIEIIASLNDCVVPIVEVEDED